MLESGVIERRLRYEDATCRLTIAGNVLAATWFDAPTVEQMREFRNVSVAMQKDHASGTAMVNLVCDGTPRFQPGVRDEAAKLMKAKIHKLGAAHVVLVDGLRGSATRAFLTTAILLGRPRAPSRVFPMVAPAVEQLHEWLHAGAVKWTLGELRAFVDGAMERRSAQSSATR
jgi:hypothetical protein